MKYDSDVEARCILERDYADSDFQKIRGIILNARVSPKATSFFLPGASL
jgi:hypothetical protein